MISLANLAERRFGALARMVTHRSTGNVQTNKHWERPFSEVVLATQSSNVNFS